MYRKQADLLNIYMLESGKISGGHERETLSILHSFFIGMVSAEKIIFFLLLFLKVTVSLEFLLLGFGGDV